MVEIRWVWHSNEDGAPPPGSIRIAAGIYQKLQYRSMSIGPFPSWSDWKDVPHAAMSEPAPDSNLIA